MKSGDACCLRPPCNSALRSRRMAPLGACALPCGGLPSWLTWSGLRSAGEVDALGHRCHCCFGRGASSYGLSSVSAQKPFLRRSPPTRCRKPPPSSRPAEVPGLRSEMLSHTGSFSAPSSPRDAGVCVPGRWGRPRRALLQPSPADGVCPRACRGDACHVVGECVRPHCCSL